jgi:hypothetical protein
MPDEPPPTPIDPSDRRPAAGDEPEPDASTGPPETPGFGAESAAAPEGPPAGSHGLPLTESPMHTVERDLLDLRENLGRGRAQAWGVDLSMAAAYALLTTILVVLVWWLWK